MGFINKLERKFGRFSIPGLTRFIIGTYIFGFIIQILTPNVVQYLTLEPYYILHGQVWRLVSWLLIPPESLDLFTVIMLLFYYQIGTVLERTWGDFRYNVYIFGGIFLTVLGAFIYYFAGSMQAGGEVLLGVIYNYGKQVYAYSPFSTYYISLSIFLGFAATYPNMQVLLMFFIPLKIKYLAWLDVAYLLYAVVRGSWGIRVVIICSLMNFIIFFLMTRNYRRFSPKEVHRRQVYKQAVHKGQMQMSKHKCAICGRTEKDNEDLEFRFCSKCNGNYEYCQDHLFTHEHVK